MYDWLTMIPMRAPALPIAVALCCCPFVALSQSDFGSIGGDVSNEAHAPVPGVTVEAKNTGTGTYYKAVTSAKGEYTLAQLPSGNYEIVILSRAYRPFVRKGVAILAGPPERLDIQLAQNISLLSTLGEIPALLEVLAKKPPPPKGPAPKMPNGKPDFSGVRQIAPSSLGAAFSQEPDLLPWANDLVRERLLNDVKDKPSARCLPEIAGFAALWPIKIVQSPKLLVTLQTDVIAAHQVYLDGRSVPADLEPSWQGYSIGKWEGDTLVIETVGYNDKTWLDILPHTGKLHVTHRLRRPDLGHLETETIYEDPGTFKTPFRFKAVNVLATDEEVEEYVCAENNQYRGH